MNKYMPREWVSLTKKEVDEIRKNIFEEYKKNLMRIGKFNKLNDYSAWNFYKQIETKLKERNE